MAQDWTANPAEAKASVQTGGKYSLTRGPQSFNNDAVSGRSLPSAPCFPMRVSNEGTLASEGAPSAGSPEERGAPLRGKA